MADFNINALNTFRNVDFGNADAIANLRQDGGVEQHGKLGNFVGKMFRSGATKAANNAVRSELLRSLGNAFGLEGMSETGGKTRFSAEFMAKLEGILGRDFLKTADFKLDRDGSVSSGKPLTQRRIQAIVDRAIAASKGEAAPAGGTKADAAGAKAPTGGAKANAAGAKADAAASILDKRGEYDPAVYRAKLGHINAKIAAMPDDGTKEAMQSHFEAVGKIIDFMEKELGDFLEENIYFDENKDVEGDNYPFVLHSRIEGKYGERPLTSIAMVTQYVHDATGQLFHIQENILAGQKNIARYDDLTEPPKQITDYLRRAMTQFVMASIDTYLDAGKAGKAKGFENVVSSTWPCIEGKTSGITEFRLANLPLDDAKPAAGAGKVGANPVATHDKDQPLNQCIGREITALSEKGVAFESWKDVAAVVKEHLIGTIRPIDVPVKDGDSWKFELLRDEKGQPVVRAITEEDIDRLGEACMDVILEG